MVFDFVQRVRTEQIMLAAPVAYLIIRVVWLSRRGARGSSAPRELALALFWLCLVYVLAKTVGPPYFTQPERYNLNLQLGRAFRTMKYDRAFLFWNVYGNIAVFVPLGFLFLAAFRKPAWAGVLFGLLASLAIEICQYPLGRWSDVDDLWLNTLGALIGSLLFAIVRKLRRRLR